MSSSFCNINKKLPMQSIYDSINMAEKNLKYSAEELLNLRNNHFKSCTNICLLPDLQLRFDGPSITYCPTTRWFFSCQWKGAVDDLERHLRREHGTVLFLKNNTITLTQDMFFVLNRGFLVNDQFGQMYFVNVCYHVDQNLYVHVIALNDQRANRNYYRVQVVEMEHVVYEGKVGGVNYVQIANLRRFFETIKTINLFISFFG